jgi:hypothetical protein
MLIGVVEFLSNNSETHWLQKLLLMVAALLSCKVTNCGGYRTSRSGVR